MSPELRGGSGHRVPPLPKMLFAIATFWERGKSVFSNGVSLGISTTSSQASCSGVADQYIIDCRFFFLCMLFFGYSLVICFLIFLFCFDFLFECYLILLSWFRGYYIVFFSFFLFLLVGLRQKIKLGG